MTDDGAVSVEPLDEDGVGAVKIGTVLWAVALAILLLMRDRLAESDSQWWIWVAATGALLGLPGLWYTTRRRSAYRERAALGPEGS